MSGTDGHHEPPFRITDYHGDTVASELGTVPPQLTQKEIDKLAAHLSESEITSVAVWSGLEKLADAAFSDGLLDDIRPHCHKCGSAIGLEEPEVAEFGFFYHANCSHMAVTDGEQR